MDGVRAFIEEIRELYQCKTLDDVIECSYGLVGFDWLEPHTGDGVGEGGSADYYDVESSEFEMRSALEFIRPELTHSQLVTLDEWDGYYKEKIAEGVFYERYAAASFGWNGTWESEREFAAKTLGRPIPTSHWWYWPPDENKDKKD